MLFLLWDCSIKRLKGISSTECAQFKMRLNGGESSRWLPSCTVLMKREIGYWDHNKFLYLTLNMLILSLILVILTWPALYFTCLPSLLESTWVHFWVQVLLILSSDCVNEDSCGCPRPCQFVSNADAHPQTLYITMNQLRMHSRRWTSKRPQRSGTGTTFSPSGFQLPKTHWFTFEDTLKWVFD